ncbi:MAG: hypothetical protein LC776_00925 [Acidobacteria bacterium]|nr:hypothetical protein [Acidobacteriota bacterium]
MKQQGGGVLSLLVPEWLSFKLNFRLAKYLRELPDLRRDSRNRHSGDGVACVTQAHRPAMY